MVTCTASGGASLLEEARRRRTFAVISHPDAGKSTLTEALALHARVISEAGAVHGKAGRRGVVSDWMAMEQQRGISVTSAALQFVYRDAVLNLVDTPGHADFSEDTYRVLAAVDCAVMLLDAAKGLEPQTLKLFDVCRHRALPVLTFINKWDRPGRDALGLIDEIEQRLGLDATPITWPVGEAGFMQGLVDRRDPGRLIRFTRAAGGIEAATEQRVSTGALEQVEAPAWSEAAEELELLDHTHMGLDRDAFLAGLATPVFFGAAASTIGVRLLLDALIDLAPSPGPRSTQSGDPVPMDGAFSGVVFKVQANMDPSHRDRIAFVRVASGVFERGMVLRHAATGRPFTTKYAHAMFGRDRSTVARAYPGDIVGLVNAGALRPGDTLYAEEPVMYPPMPAFSPEHFSAIRTTDPGRAKQFRRGISQLGSEGVIQVLVSDRRGSQAPVLAAVGPMQFDVVAHRLEHEFGVPTIIEPLPYRVARRTDQAGRGPLERRSGLEVLTRLEDDELLVLFPDNWSLHVTRRDLPDVRLDPLIAAGE